MSPPEPRSRLWGWWWAYFVAFFLVAGGWAMALPANGTYDEKDHIARAYAVVSGQLTTRQTVVDRRDDVRPAFLVPASLLPPNSNVDCTWSPRPARSAACQTWTTSRALTLTPSGAAKYSPVYYLLVGGPLLAAPDLTGIVLARLLSVLVTAALLAGAIGAALRLGSRLLAIGVVLTATPMAANLAGSVNPNGVEIAAGAAVCCGLLALLRAPEGRLGDGTVRRLLLLVGAASFVLLTVRQLGPLLLLLIVAACAALARPGRIAGMWRHHGAVWLVVGSWVAGLAASAGWMAYSGLADVATVARDARHYGVAEAARLLLTWRVPFYLKQFVGQFGYGETSPSAVVAAVWYLLLAALTVPSLIFGGRRLTLVAAGLGAASIGLLVALEIYYLPVVGWFAQGRYAMPAAVGVVLCVASDGRFERWLAARRRLRAFCGGLTVVAGLIHVYMLVVAMTRFQAGPGAPLDPFAGAWQPLLGPLPPLLATLTGVTIFAVLAATMGAAARPLMAVPTLPGVGSPRGGMAAA
ncbi:DUF2142 domain-containing protein [Dactylosporangium sucinum]|uniref:DUF2142 domain-containing protein n=1 Tax=Dactylosporangium sucinum TaxID=1424081 RepID=A0A917TQ91_9ACTN|nr:DUF2142 domain-containing protein [Dactylosporangium sucinum]GGM33010.1 hypothetical protein GCM10007977_037980 [Dactylosporangium sucinum]